MELFPFMVSEATGQRTEVELCLAKVQTMGKMAKTAYISLAVSCWGNKVNYSMGTVSLNKEYLLLLLFYWSICFTMLC